MNIFKGTIIKISASLLLFGLILFSTSCVNESDRLTTARENFTLSLPTIEVINLDFPATVLIKKGVQQSVKINAQPEIFEAVTKTVENGEWSIDLGNFSGSYESVTIELTLPTFSGLLTSSTGDIIVEDYFQDIEALNLEIQSTGNIVFRGAATQIDLLIDGTGDISLEGLSSQLNAQLDGTGNLSAFDLITKVVDLASTSTGDAEIFVEEELIVTMTGTGDVKYKGNPVITSMISGTGELRDEN